MKTPWYDVLADINKEKIKETGKGLFENVTEIEYRDWEKNPFDTRYFFNNYLKKHRPVLLQGFAK